MTYTPPEIARRYRVSADKVRAWIERGELRAVNVADTTARRPRWRVTDDALRAFEAARAATPRPKIQRVRRRRQATVTEWF